MINTPLLVTVVDDDESVRESLPDLLKDLGYAVLTFSSGEEFLASDCMLHTKCLILDIAMPGIGGPDLKRELERRKLKYPVIFMTGRRDEALRARMLENGAVDCLFKPFSDAALQRALDLALKGK
jgi:FixJ family two-component response regulator